MLGLDVSLQYSDGSTLTPWKYTLPNTQFLADYDQNIMSQMMRYAVQSNACCGILSDFKCIRKSKIGM